MQPEVDACVNNKEKYTSRNQSLAKNFVSKDNNFVADKQMKDSNNSVAQKIKSVVESDQKSDLSHSSKAIHKHSYPVDAKADKRSESSVLNADGNQIFRSNLSEHLQKLPEKLLPFSKNALNNEKQRPLGKEMAEWEGMSLNQSKITESTKNSSIESKKLKRALDTEENSTNTFQKKRVKLHTLEDYSNVEMIDISIQGTVERSVDRVLESDDNNLSQNQVSSFVIKTSTGEISCFEDNRNTIVPISSKQLNSENHTMAMEKSNDCCKQLNEAELIQITEESRSAFANVSTSIQVTRYIYLGSSISIFIIYI